MKPKFVVVRANPTSPFGAKNRHLAFAVDAHKCLLFLCENVGGSVADKLKKVVKVELTHDMSFDDLYGRFLE